MKKRALLPLLLSLLLIVSLAGCSSSTKDSASKKSATAKTEKTVSEKTKSSKSNQVETAPGAPGSGGTAPTMKNGAGPGAAAGTRIMGQIVSIKDRTVTLALISMPSAPSGNGTRPSAPPSGSTPPAGGNQPGGQTPQLSGEKKTITIPSTVKIYSGGRDDSTEVAISSLKTGQMMEVRLNSATNAVEEVRVREEGQGGPAARGNAPGPTGGTSAN